MNERNRKKRVEDTEPPNDEEMAGRERSHVVEKNDDVEVLRSESLITARNGSGRENWKILCGGAKRHCPALKNTGGRKKQEYKSGENEKGGKAASCAT